MTPPGGAQTTITTTTTTKSLPGRAYGAGKYVSTPDPAYTWKLRTTVTGTDYTTYFIDMTSQSWRSAAEVDRTVWKHDPMITVPKNRLPGRTSFTSRGGSNGGTPPMTPSDTSLSLARLVRAPVIERQAGAEPAPDLANHDGAAHRRRHRGVLVVAGDEDRRSQLERALPDGEERRAGHGYGARVPVQQGRRQPAARRLCGDGRLEARLDDVADGGGGSAGRRLRAIVIDVLNVNKFMIQHIESYGFWALSLYDYYYNHITERIGTKEMNTLFAERRPVFLPRQPEDAEVHRERDERSVLPARWLAELPRRSQGERCCAMCRTLTTR